MATRSAEGVEGIGAAGGAGAVAVVSGAYERFAGVCAVLVAVVNFLYAVSFVILKNGVLFSLFLMLGGLISTAVLAALYGRLRVVDRSFALLALLLTLVGAVGATIHGGYDFANELSPSATYTSLAALPSFVDPRGLLTFGVTALGLIVFAWLMGRAGTVQGQGQAFPRWLSYLGYLLAILLLVLYLGRLFIYNPANPAILVPALLSGFIVSPLWYLCLGLALWRSRAQ